MVIIERLDLLGICKEEYLILKVCLTTNSYSIAGYVAGLVQRFSGYENIIYVVKEIKSL